MTPLVEVSELSVSFGRARAVDGVSLRLYRGEVLALVGESGSGKTTLIRAIKGLVKPSSGSVSSVGGRAVQMVFQDPTGALNPRHTIYEIVAEGLRIHRDAAGEAERVAAALARAGLRPPERFVDLYPHQISGGQRQRVVIAGAMVMEPAVLLADEPVASLDASVRGEILAILRGLVDTAGLAMLVVTHDLGLAWNIADRVAVMYLGRVVETGPTEQLLSHPLHPYTRALLSVVPEMAGIDQQILTGEIPDPTNIPAGCRFHPRCPLLSSGVAERLGIAERCRTMDPGVLTADSITAAACWAVDIAFPPG